MDNLNKRLREAVHRFSKEGYQLTKGAFRLLSKADDPVHVSMNVIEKMKKSEKKEFFITPELIKWGYGTFPSRQVYRALTGEEFEDWTFASADTQLMTHGLHLYPARMIPQVAEKLITRYSSEGDLVLDPFCGSGTVLVEAAVKGRSALGVDLNPLAVIISRAKAIAISPDQLNEKYTYFVDKLTYNNFKKVEDNELGKFVPPMSTNVRYWFGENTIKSLAFIRMLMKENEDEEARCFLYTCFSNTLYKYSWAKFDGSSTHLRKNTHNHHAHEIFTYFLKNLKSCMGKMKDYYNRVKPSQITVEVVEGDARKLSSLVKDNADLIVTSPPYGEERNTINYTRWTKLALFWLGYDVEMLRETRKKTLGGQTIRSEELMDKEVYQSSFELRGSLDKIKNNSLKRVSDVLSFFDDYFTCLKEFHTVLNNGKKACIVISSTRRCSGFPLSLGKITRELGESIGFRFVDVFHRKLPYKTIPWMGISGETMSKEDIVVLQKQR